jgi:hypothetical protein
VEIYLRNWMFFAKTQVRAVHLEGRIAFCFQYYNIISPEGDKVYVRNHTIICIEGCEMKT